MSVDGRCHTTGYDGKAKGSVYAKNKEKVHFRPSNFCLSLVLTIKLQNRISLTIQLSNRSQLTIGRF
jgi:hypothetical protein